MATYCTGLRVSWGGKSFQEVVGLRVNASRSMPIARDAIWSLDLGTIEIECLSDVNVDLAEYGTRKPLRISKQLASGESEPAGVFAIAVDCIYESVEMQCELNGVARYKVTFRIMDTIDAPSANTAT